MMILEEYSYISRGLVVGGGGGGRGRKGREGETEEGRGMRGGGGEREGGREGGREREREETVVVSIPGIIHGELALNVTLCSNAKRLCYAMLCQSGIYIM